MFIIIIIIIFIKGCAIDATIYFKPPSMNLPCRQVLKFSLSPARFNQKFLTNNKDISV